MFRGFSKLIFRKCSQLIFKKCSQLIFKKCSQLMLERLWPPLIQDFHILYLEDFHSWYLKDFNIFYSEDPWVKLKDIFSGPIKTYTVLFDLYKNLIQHKVKKCVRTHQIISQWIALFKSRISIEVSLAKVFQTFFEFIKKGNFQFERKVYSK